MPNLYARVTLVRFFCLVIAGRGIIIIYKVAQFSQNEGIVRRQLTVKLLAIVLTINYCCLLDVSYRRNNKTRRHRLFCRNCLNITRKFKAATTMFKTMDVVYSSRGVSIVILVVVQIYVRHSHTSL